MESPLSPEEYIDTVSAELGISPQRLFYLSAESEYGANIDSVNLGFITFVYGGQSIKNNELLQGGKVGKSMGCAIDRFERAQVIERMNDTDFSEDFIIKNLSTKKKIKFRSKRMVVILGFSIKMLKNKFFIRFYKSKYLDRIRQFCENNQNTEFIILTMDGKDQISGVGDLWNNSLQFGKLK